MAMALYPAMVWDGTGNWPLLPEWNQEEIPPAQQPRVIAERGEVTTDTTDHADDVVDEVEDTVDD